MQPTWQSAVKAAIDRIAAAALAVAMAPLLAAIALAVKLDSPGPVLFTQERVGRHGSLFRVFKFRTMVEDADRLLDAQGRVQGARVTRVGKWLRRTSLDELPQLFNILRGEMSFIGPRPTQADHWRRYDDRQKRRTAVRPGVTGLAQVSGRNTIPWSRRIELDLQYVDHYSLWLDLKIAARTVGAVLLGTGVVMDRNTEQMDDLPRGADETAALSAISGRAEPKLVGPYRKDLRDEQFLKTLTDPWAEVPDSQLGVDGPPLPTVHVIGAPRSGTTVTTQLLAASLDVGYVNNLVASFWRAPVFGLRLSQKVLGPGGPTTFASDFGRTRGIREPHEFGYFWSDVLGYRDMQEQPSEFEDSIDWARIRRLFANMTDACGKPMVFKSFLLAWHLQRTVREMPDSLFVWVRRDPVENALSLLRAREKQLGSADAWISMRPRQYEWLRHESPEVQTAGQVRFVEQAIERQAGLVDSRNLIEVNYDQLCRNPAELVDAVAVRLDSLGCPVYRTSPPPDALAAVARPEPDAGRRARVAAAVAAFQQGRFDDRMRTSAAA